MRKVILATLVSMYAVNAQAQAPTYYPITHSSGVQVINGQNVTVTPFGGATMTAPSCGVGPYLLGNNQTGDGRTYSFSATHVRIRVVNIHSHDTIRFSINGSPYALQPADVSAYTGSCGATPSGIITGDGQLTSTQATGTPSGGVEIILQTPPNPMNSVTVAANTSAPFPSGTVYSVEFANDSCAMKVTATNNDPCPFRDLILNATPFPGATFNWTGPGGWTGTGAQVVRPNILVSQWGDYIVTVNWGSCTFKDTTLVTVNAKATPQPPTITVQPGSANPICKNMDLELYQVSTGAAGVDYYWYGPGIWPPVNSQILSVPTIQPSQAGIYYAYAVSGGCTSDTSQLLVTMLPDVTAGMNVTWKYGCETDTVIIQNTSTGNNISNVYFNPFVNNQTTVNLVDVTGNPVVTIYKPHVLTDTIPDTIDVKLVVGNGTCNDSLTQRVVFNHPVKARMSVSDDTICQRTEITFNNHSSAAVGPTHIYLWDFKNGDTSQQYSKQYTYMNSGVYRATLTVTDYLGCKDSASQLIFVDSTGAIFYTVSDSVICAGDVINFKGDFSRVGNVSTLWEFGDGNQHADREETMYAFDLPGKYTVKFTSFNRVCPDTFTTREMLVNPYPRVELGEDTSICPNGAPLMLFDLVNVANPLAKFRWNTPERDSGANVLVRHPGVYAVTVEVDDCATTDSVTVFKNCYVNIPNSFTPNGDGVADYFLPRQLLSSGVKRFAMVIYNRWGQKVFESTTTDGRGWDGMFNGEPQPLGVYVYQISATFTNDVSENYTGNVTLLR